MAEDLIIERTNISGYSVPVAGFVHAVVVKNASNLLMISGLTGRENGLIEEGVNAGEQARRIFRSMRAILASAGAGPQHVIRVVQYFVNLARDYELVNQEREVFFGALRPASTSVEVARLFDRRQVIEVEATAAIPSPRV